MRPLVAEDPCKDTKYLESSVDTMRVQKDEVCVRDEVCGGEVCEGEVCEGEVCEGEVCGGEDCEGEVCEGM